MVWKLHLIQFTTIGVKNMDDPIYWEHFCHVKILKLQVNINDFPVWLKNETKLSTIVWMQPEALKKKKKNQINTNETPSFKNLV